MPDIDSPTPRRNEITDQTEPHLVCARTYAPALLVVLVQHCSESLEDIVSYYSVPFPRVVTFL